MEVKQILAHYWGFNQFRPLQEEIIASVLEGKDTLALMPTGGGKSLCFQVPALANEGLCVVVSPLIALMKDQVMQLKKRGITAIALHSGMSLREADVALDNCVYGKTRLLYVSPERLSNEMFRERLQRMKVNLLAVDEAHCISQWGYDFRPTYLHIAGTRQLLPGVPVLALTATATPRVCEDIMDKLLFSRRNIFRKSFERKNLSYSVLQEEDKQGRLLKMLKKVPGTAIVYVRNRRRTKEVADFLKQNAIKAEDYHAGLGTTERSARQERWMDNKTRVMVSTNAFGMGIDKPDVRLVVHWDVPENPESYYQEAGRAGRDERKSFAVLLHTPSDVRELNNKIENAFPSPEEVKQVYHALGNYFQLAEGAGEGVSFDFDIVQFSQACRLHPLKVHRAIYLLQQEGYLAVSDSVYLPARIMVIVDKETLYRFEIANPPHERLIKTLLRSYAGIFDYYVPVREEEMARHLGTISVEVVKELRYLQQVGLIDYQQRKDMPQLTYLVARRDRKDLVINKGRLKERKETIEHQLVAMKAYLMNNVSCRSQQLLAYFGETSSARCGICDVCLKRHDISVNDIEFDTLLEHIQKLLLAQPLTIAELVEKTPGISEDKTIETVRWLLDNNKLKQNNERQLSWR